MDIGIVSGTNVWYLLREMPPFVMLQAVCNFLSHTEDTFWS